MSSQRQSFFSTISDDIRNSQPFITLRKESKEIADFYLTDEQRSQLKQMRAAKRSFYISGWVLKAMFYKLTPFRRLLFVLGVLMVLTVRSEGEGVNLIGNSQFGGLFLALVILLELKDKLLAWWFAKNPLGKYSWKC